MTSLRSGVKMGLMKNKSITYDLNYIKKNIDLKKFIELLKTEGMFDGGDAFLNLDSWAIMSCANPNNKDPILKNHKQFEKLNEKILIQKCFYRMIHKDMHFNSIGDEDFYKDPPDEIMIDQAELFVKEINKSIIDGTLLEKIHPNFKLLYHFELTGEWEKNDIDSHSFVQSKYGDTNNFLYVVNFTQDNQNVVKFCKKMNIESFIYEIINFKERRGFKGKEFFIDRKTKKNILDEYNIVYEQIS